MTMNFVDYHKDTKDWPWGDMLTSDLGLFIFFSATQLSTAVS